ncbi:substrate-binding domain-containing protein [Devosia psychrophila]|nr:substrate-binding domain-containing protein [Devosia psychrophila]
MERLLSGCAMGIVALSMVTTPVAYAQDAIKVGLILPSYDQIRWQNGDQPCFEAEAEKLGMDVSTVASQMSESVQASQVENMLTQGIDVLVLRPVNAAASQGLVRMANRANVPVVAYDSLPLNADVAAFVARDAIAMAVEIAEAAVKAQPKGNYILALGDEGTNVAVEERTGYYQVLQPFLDSGAIKIVSEQYNKGWSSESSRAQVENGLTKANNDVVAVLAGNDGTAYGAIQALQAQGLAGKVWVNGVDAEPRAQELITQGDLTLSNFTDYCQSGQEAARIAKKLVTGEELGLTATFNNGLKDVPWFQVDKFNVTKDNLPELQESMSWWFKKP